MEGADAAVVRAAPVREPQRVPVSHVDAAVREARDLDRVQVVPRQQEIGIIFILMNPK